MAIKTHKVTLSLDNPRVIQSGINVQSFDKQSIQISIELTKNYEVFQVPSDATIRISLLKLANQSQRIIVDVPNTNRESIDWIVPDYLDGYQGTVRVGVYLVSGTQNVDLGYFTILSNVSDIDKMADEFVDNVFQGWEQIEADLNELNLTIAQTKLDLAQDMTQVDNTIANINTLASDFEADVATKQTDVTSKYNAFDTSVTTANQTIDELLALQPQFQAVLDETTGKDVISAPEIILARGGAQTLGERLDSEKAEFSAQLAQTNSDLLNTNVQITQKVGNGKLATMADMDQDVKTAMTGGSVAVVGEYTIIEKNVVDKQITPRKTSFLEQDSDNVLDPDFKNLYNCTYSNGIVESNVMNANQPFYINISPINPATGNSNMTLSAGLWYISMRIKTQNGVGEIEPSLFDKNAVRYKGSWYSGNKGAIPTNYVDLKFKITLTSSIESVGMVIFSLKSDKYFIENLMISNKDIPFVTYHKYSFGSSINKPNLKIMDEKISRISKKIVNPAFDFSYLRTYAHRALVHPINTLDGYPENTLPAFEHASNMGVDLVEIDVKRTSDGFFVLSHDETIDRVSNGTGKISEMTLSDLQQYDFSYVGGQKMPKFINELVKIPTLEEAIITAKRLGLNIVLDIGILNWDIMLVHNVVLAHNYEKHVMYNIQSIYYIQRLLSFDPYAVVFYTNSNMPDATTIEQLIELQSDLNTIGFGTQYTHFISSNPKKDENKAIVQQLVNSGLAVSAATINHSEITQHPNLLDDLVSIGIQCICTDELRIEQKQKIVMNINDYIQLNQTAK